MACLLTKAYYMTQNYTINDLVRLVYHETSCRQAEELHEEIAYDFELAEEYAMLKKAMRELPRVTFSPSQRCLDNILDYSRRTMLAI
jgi:hypothetical protein